ncbi:MAG: energy transducer TonB [Acidobacteria bacterium]|nr:energy transducer TonB [Acidobacteriota bacterium]
MFESALVDSANRIQTRSRYWMLATTSFNAAILAAMVLIPMLYPEALPRSQVTAMLQPPLLPHAAPPKQPARPVRVSRASAGANPFVAPAQIPQGIHPIAREAPPQISGGVQMGARNGTLGSDVPIAIATGPSLPVISVVPRKPTVQRVSAGVIAGMNISRTTPVYPAIARAAHVGGTVELHALISKSGTIEGLSVVSGPEMLRAAAVDAVKTWRYRPYLLNGEPVDVETTITVHFTLGS